MLALIGTKHSSFFPCFLQRTKLRKKEAGQQETNDPNKHKVGLTKSLKNIRRLSLSLEKYKFCPFWMLEDWFKSLFD
jgi:hypothetical protein